MKPSERRAAMKKEMEERSQESYNNKDGSGKFKPYFNLGTNKNPMFKCTEDDHFIDIIPFVAGSKNPSLKPGKIAYHLDVQVHRKVGVNEDTYICLSRTYGKPCPICEAQAELMKQDEYDDKYRKSLNPTRRVMYNIVCKDSPKDEAKGIQIFEVSHFLFEKALSELAKKPRGGGFTLFSDPDEGKTVFFRKSGKGATDTEYKAFSFEDREEPISDEILDAALCLDDLLYVPSYEEVYAAFHGEEIPGAEETTTAAAAPVREKKKVFVCPGQRPADFGELEACDTCPYVADCEVECQEAAEAALAAEGGSNEPEEAEVVKETAPPVARRRAANTEAPAQQEQAAEPAAEGRRVRRRPGGE